MIAGVAWLLAGCATTAPSPAAGAGPAPQRPSTLERTNRAVLKFNQGFNTVVVSPVLSVYRWVLPPFLRKGIANVTVLAGEPLTFVNDVLQGEGRRAANTFGRFMVNATLGVGGLFDTANRMGLPPHDEDFGQTLAVWGVGDGAFLIVPFLGPTTVRDGFGLGLGIVGDPVGIALSETGQNTAAWALTGANALVLLDTRYDALQALEATSLDFYAALESAYRQSRAAEIRNGAPAPAAAPGEDPLDVFETPAQAPPAQATPGHAAPGEPR